MRYLLAVAACLVAGAALAQAPGPGPVPPTAAGIGLGTADTPTFAGVTLTGQPGIASPNLLLNGAMDLDQPNEGGSVTLINDGTPANGPDGWVGSLNASVVGGTTTMQRVASTLPGYLYGLKFTVGTGGGPLTTSMNGILYQGVAFEDMRNLEFGAAGARPLYASGSLNCSVAGSFGVSLANPSAPLRSFVHMVVVSSINTDTAFSFPVPGDTGGTWVASATDVGMYYQVAFGTGPDVWTASPDTWVATLSLSTSSQTQLTATTGASCTITAMKLEQGSFATPFVHEESSALLARAQKRYYKTFPPGVAPAQNAGLPGAACTRNPIALGEPNLLLQWPQPMFIAPTITTYNPSAANANWRDVTAGSDVTMSKDPASALGASTGVLLATSGTVATLGDVLCAHVVVDGSLQ